MLIKVLIKEYSQLPRLIKEISKQYKIPYYHFDRWLHITKAAALLQTSVDGLLSQASRSRILHVVGMPDGKAFVHPAGVIQTAKARGKRAALSIAKKIYQSLINQ
jgi:hypothetical protein